MKNIDKIKSMNSEELIEKVIRSPRCLLCSYYKSDKCNSALNCNDGIKAWLEQEVTPILTDDEKVILRNIDKRYKWIARDKDDDLCVYSYSPVKTQSCWIRRVGDYHNATAFNHLFQFVQWGDEEPYEIEKLLGE